MSATASNELWSVFDARRVKAPELKGLDAVANSAVGWVKNRRRMLAHYKKQVERIEAMEKEVHELGSTRFAEEVQKCRDIARLNRMEDPALERSMALVREAALRAVGMRPFAVQLMGALCMIGGNIAEMATGEGKTLTASLAASVWAWFGRPVHVLTVNDYLVERDAHEMGPVYKQLGLRVGTVIHETSPDERIDQYRRDVVYVTSKELVADFLRDQIMLGNLRTGTQTGVGLLMSGQNLAQRLMVQMRQTFESRGYSLADFEHDGQLGASGSERVPIHLSSGTNEVVGLCDNNCSDMDLELIDASGKIVASDLEKDDFPIVDGQGGDYSLLVKMVKCNTATCSYELRVWNK